MTTGSEKAGAVFKRHGRYPIARRDRCPLPAKIEHDVPVAIRYRVIDSRP